MVGGVKKFEEHFRGFQDRYVLIGGTACDLVCSEQGLDFGRVTKDFDLVLCVEALDDGFVRLIWDFIRQGQYEIKQKSGSRCLYRFAKPRSAGFPSMLELFSRRLDAVDVADGAACTPVPAGAEDSSLSAILLEEESYRFLMTSTAVIRGVHVATAECLIPLKARAWMDLRKRKEAGEKVDSKNIAKHRNDIYRLSRLLPESLRMSVPPAMKESLQSWDEAGSSDPLQEDHPALGGVESVRIHALLKGVYQL